MSYNNNIYTNVCSFITIMFVIIHHNKVFDFLQAKFILKKISSYLRRFLPVIWVEKCMRVKTKQHIE